jgi:basic membrane lipoprotein Med (substrate-binding protein (PBP1-ABC) superfamily)
MRHSPRPLVLSVVLGLAAAALAACGGTTGNENDKSSGANADAPLVYGVFATPLEEPWDGAIHKALTAAADDGDIQYKHVDNVATSDKMESALRDIAENEKPDAIVGDAFAAEDAVRAVAKDYPDIVFAFGSGEGPQEPNLSVFDNWMQDPAYLAGMLAGGLTKSNTIGVVGAMPIPEVNRIVNGFIEGVQAENPDATVKVSFINSFFDPAAAKQAANAQIDAGADVLFAERDGVIAAAHEAGIPSVGMMVDQSDEAPDSVVTSLLWDMRPTIDAVVKQVGDPQATDLGQYSFMKNGGSNIADINTDITGGVPQDLVDKVMAKKQEIESGDFEVEVDESAPKGSITAK